MKDYVQFIPALILMLLLTTGLTFVYGYVRSMINGEGIRGMVLWHHDWNTAVAEAAANHKPLLVEFARETSPNCHELAKNGWFRGDIAYAASNDYVPILLDIDVHRDIASQFGVGTVPSLLVIDASSMAVIRDGRDYTFTPDHLLRWLKPDSGAVLKVSIPRDFTLDSQKRFDNQNSPFAP
jgi:hypothetical protein